MKFRRRIYHPRTSGARERALLSFHTLMRPDVRIRKVSFRGPFGTLKSLHRTRGGVLWRLQVRLARRIGGRFREYL